MPDDHADLHAVAAALAATPKARLTPKRTANALRRFVRARGALTFTSVEDDPERFFGAHRALATHATTLGPGFWIRFTVQYQLCSRGRARRWGRRRSARGWRRCDGTGSSGAFV